MKLHELVRRSDVFITNVPRIDSLRRAHIDPDTLRALNPRLIYAAISGYGHTGPKAGRGGYDIIAQGESGLMALTGGADDGPTRFPTPMSDITAGIYTVIGILSALLARAQSGHGTVHRRVARGRANDVAREYWRQLFRHRTAPEEDWQLAPDHHALPAGAHEG